MKRFLYLLLALPLMGLMASCSDDEKDLPDVTFSMDYSGATLVDGVLTIPQGNDLVINALSVTPAEGTKKATLGRVTYFIDAFPIYETIVDPYSVTISTQNLEVGKHVLQIRAGIFQVDKEAAFGVFSYPLEITEPVPDDTPGDNPGDTVTPDVTITESE
ncbi:MAG: hypothetical protein K2O30_05305 [Duncaniella sp.]|nr:hypothetical protein [Duncaniella sp.]MDE7145549.1 hypothetical protein [Duncaniella sp.]